MWKIHFVIRDFFTAAMNRPSSSDAICGV